jgi:hypothetical protein
MSYDTSTELIWTNIMALSPASPADRYLASEKKKKVFTETDYRI